MYLDHVEEPAQATYYTFPACQGAKASTTFEEYVLLSGHSPLYPSMSSDKGNKEHLWSLSKFSSFFLFFFFKIRAITK